MFSKRILSSILCLVMLFSLCIPVSAASLSDTGNKDVTVTYGTSENFIVTVPANFEIDETAKAVAEISASDVMIASGSTLEVYISGDDYDGSWKLIDSAENNNTLTYVIGSSEGASDIINGSTVLTVEAGEAYDSTVSEKMYFEVIDTLSKSGIYTDTLTFIVEVSGGAGKGYSALSTGKSIFLSDVATMEHELDIQLTSDTVTDFSGVTVTRVGQNLLDIDSMVNAASPDVGNLYDNGDGTYTLSKVGNARFSAFTDIFIPEGSILKMSAVLVEESADGASEKLKIGLRGADPSTEAVWLSAAGLGSVPANYAIPFDVVEVYLSIDGAEGIFVTFEKMQIAINVDKSPKYQPYNAETVVADEDGSVTGLTSTSPTMLIYTNNENVEIECKYRSKKEQITYDLSDKVIVNFGDSIFGNNQPTMDISTYIEDLTKATVYNAGFGGTRMGTHIEYYDDFSMDSLADAIVSHDFSAQKTSIANFDSFPSYYSDTVSMLESLDFSNVDIITIAHGTNDFAGGSSLDEVSTALQYSIDAIQAEYPNLEIVLCSPIYRFWMDEDGNLINDSDTKTNAQGEKLSEYSAEYESIANEYGLYFIDNYNGSGINASNRDSVFPANDGTHPNSTGRQMIAEYMAEKLYEYFG